MLEEQIQKVRKLREQVGGFQTLKDRHWMAFQETHIDLFNNLNAAKAECAEAEQALRDMTIQTYKETGNKAPSPGVGIRIITKLIYDAGKALEWAKQHGLALKLDISAFEKIAKADKPNFVDVVEEPTATIAVDLGKLPLETGDR